MLVALVAGTNYYKLGVLKSRTVLSPGLEDHKPQTKVLLKAPERTLA